jgi:hypothetical protein
MKMAPMSLFLAGLFLSVSMPAVADQTNPIAKVLSMINDLEGKITAEGAASKKNFEEFSEWCEETSKNVAYEIKTGKGEAEKLTATITSASSDIVAADSKIEELTGSISADEADLKAATEIRAKENADFNTVEADLLETSSMLERAISVLEREAAKGGASFAQIQKAGNLAKALSIMVDASVIQSQDAAKLTALVQSSQGEEDGSEELSAPAGAVYESKSGNIIETLEGLLDKAKSELESARDKEKKSLNAFGMLKQSLTDELKFANKDLASTKKSLAETSELKATSEGDLQNTNRDLAEDEKDLDTTHHDCMTKAEEYEAEVASRTEELKALAAAEKAIADKTGGAESQSYGLDQMSLFQLGRSSLKTRVDLNNFEAIRIVRDLARKQHSETLALLATRLASAARNGANPFGKIKGLISDMIDKLESEALKDATKKAYCDKQISETAASKAEKDAEISKLTTTIDSKTAKSAQLKQEVSGLQNALAELASSQAEMDKMRTEEHTQYLSNKKDMELGLEGVKLALQILNDYYAKADKAHSSADGAGSGIIGMIEVCESDFSKGLSEMTVAEETAASEHDKTSKENEISKTTKEQSVKYKTKESTTLDKEIAEAKSDLSGVQAEHDAVMEFSGKITEECVAKPEPYAERAARRDSEIAGLKTALEVLESETALVQRSTARRTLRGVHRHTNA